MKGFMEFIREQGVVGLAVGFVLGGAVGKLVSSLVQDVINPILGIFLGAAGDLGDTSLVVGSAEIMWGKFVVVCIDFVVVALVVYWGVKKLGLDKLDKKKK
jgi:large conductance mechanosensitive channel